MSKTIISYERVNEVRHHPDADRLDIVQVLGYQVIVGRDQFKVGDGAIYFPPDILIPEHVSEPLGVTKYLKHAVYPGDIGKSQCRVAACRLRGIPSHGFLVSSELGVEFGTNLTETFCGKKYEPPVRFGAGDAEQENANFPRYTNIENIQRYGSLIPDGVEVVISEKLHGTNVRLGYIQEGGDWVFAAGSHKVRRKSGSGLYWEFMSDNMKEMLLRIHKTRNCNVVVYGEIFGPGIQDLDYGLSTKELRVFDIAVDIAVDGYYLSYDCMKEWCDRYDIKTVPLLYRGPYSKEVVEEHTYGPTTFQGVKSKFKDREGCVVKPIGEIVHPRYGRLILKSVSADYRNRKGAQDIE